MDRWIKRLLQYDLRIIQRRGRNHENTGQPEDHVWNKDVGTVFNWKKKNPGISMSALLSKILKIYNMA